MHIKGSGTHGSLILEAGGTSGTTNLMYLQGHNNAGTAIGEISFDETAADQGGLTFKTNGGTLTTKMTLTSAGRVGVGTSTARAGLAVALGASTIPTAGANTAAALFGNELDDGAYGVIIGANGSGTGYLQAQRGDGNTTVYPLTLNPNGGNLGIGTTSPNANLQVGDYSGTTGISIGGVSNGYSYLYFADGNSGTELYRGYLQYYHVDDSFQFGASGTERMRIDSSGRLLVNRSASASNGAIAQFASSVGPHISVNNTTGAGAYMLFQNSASGDGAADGLFVGTDGAAKAYLWNYESGLVFGNNNASVGQFIGTKFNVPGVYNGTTTGGFPVYVEADGDLLRYTSSLKYKTDIETLEDARADAILNCRPVWYRSKCENDIKTEGAEKSDWGWYGFIAEEVAEIEPRLVNWATKDSVEQEDKTTLSVERDPADYEAEGVRYDNFIPLMLNLIKRQKAQIEDLEARLSTLEAS